MDGLIVDQAPAVVVVLAFCSLPLVGMAFVLLGLSWMFHCIPTRGICCLFAGRDSLDTAWYIIDEYAGKATLLMGILDLLIAAVLYVVLPSMGLAVFGGIVAGVIVVSFVAVTFIVGLKIRRLTHRADRIESIHMADF